ncbi:MAG: AAA family ATPase, partial [bacterium]|nr:AAA family ATPase [bacterium]
MSMSKKCRVIAVASSKGGVGKSTIATNLAVETARAGLEVLLVDTDPQASSTLFAATRSEDRPAFRSIQMTKPILHREIPKLSEPYDLAFLDTGGRETTTFRSALTAADLILVPVIPSAYDIWASEDVFTVIDEVTATSIQLGLFYQFTPEWSLGISYTTEQDTDPYTWNSTHAN